MPMFRFQTAVTDRQLRQFGLLCLPLLPLLTWYWTRNDAWTLIAAAAGMLLSVVGVLCPRILKPLFTLLMMISIPVGIVVGELILLIIYFGLFFPMAVIIRIIGRDALERRTSSETRSFWKSRPDPVRVERYFRQY